MEEVCFYMDKFIVYLLKNIIELYCLGNDALIYFIELLKYL